MIEDQNAANDQATTPKTRRRFSTVEKKKIVREDQLPGCSVAQVAQAQAVNANQLFKWRRQYLDESVPCSQQLVPIHVEPSQRSYDEPDGRRIEIELGNGCRITVRGDANPVLLGTALKSLAR